MYKQETLIFALIALVCGMGWGMDLMDIDASQYASMSREMMQSGSYLQVFDLGKDYLDKPPFLFWISALSMKLFGITPFAYRFPSFLFSVLAVYSTYKLAEQYYPKKTAIWSALVLATAQAFFLMNHDVRTDTILMGWVALSIWQLAAWYQNGRWIHFFWGFVAIAGGMMTKGPIAVMVPAFAFGCHFILQRKWSVFFKWQYLLGLAIIFVLLIPMNMGLYQQFDLHPEKIVNGKTQVSGLRFFYWTQSFGRITGESAWNNNSHIFFLLQNMLWSFLPWIAFFIIALFFRLKEIFLLKFKLEPPQEAITTGGFLLTYLSLGISKYQLPHYIFVAFPFAAIITAHFLQQLLIEKKYPRLLKILFPFHVLLLALFWMVLFILLRFSFEDIPKWVVILWTLGMMGLFQFYRRKKSTPAFLLMYCLYSMIGINFFLNTFFYPSLLKYQAGSTAGKWLKEHKIPLDKTFTYQYTIWRSLPFAAAGNVLHTDSLAQVQKGHFLISSAQKIAEIEAAGRKCTVLHEGVDYPVSRLKLKFLNPKTRTAQLTKYVIVEMK